MKNSKTFLIVVALSGCSISPTVSNQLEISELTSSCESPDDRYKQLEEYIEDASGSIAGLKGGVSKSSIIRYRTLSEQTLIQLRNLNELCLKHESGSISDQEYINAMLTTETIVHTWKVVVGSAEEEAIRGIVENEQSKKISISEKDLVEVEEKILSLLDSSNKKTYKNLTKLNTNQYLQYTSLSNMYLNNYNLLIELKNQYQMIDKKHKEIEKLEKHISEINSNLTQEIARLEERLVSIVDYKIRSSNEDLISLKITPLNQNIETHKDGATETLNSLTEGVGFISSKSNTIQQEVRNTQDAVKSTSTNISSLYDGLCEIKKENLSIWKKGKILIGLMNEPSCTDLVGKIESKSIAHK